MKTDSKKKIILVDSNDREIGLETKENVHSLGLLHRAYSIFIFRQREGVLEILLQQRAMDKYHSAGLWSNTCCSHPEQNLVMEEHAQNRLEHEMGLTASLTRCGKFHYCANLPNGLIENEIDHIFVGFKNIDNIEFNKEEVLQVRWDPVIRTIVNAQENPKNYSVWFLKGLLQIVHNKQDRMFKEDVGQLMRDIKISKKTERSASCAS